LQINPKTFISNLTEGHIHETSTPSISASGGRCCRASYGVSDGEGAKLSDEAGLTDPRAESLKAQILREVPKARSITVMAIMGDAEAIQFAQEIHAFMKSNGFLMKKPDGISQGVFSGAVKGLSMKEENGGITFIVGANIQ
jgi:hypothetical protein